VKACQQYNWQILAWVILDNHYHIMLEAPEEAGTLVNLIRDLHRIKGLWIKRKISIAKEVKKVWYNYWDTCITYERSFLARFNYVHHNLVKHGYVKDASQYPFGSYYMLFRQQKDVWLRNEIQYPWDEVKVYDDF